MLLEVGSPKPFIYISPAWNQSSLKEEGEVGFWRPGVELDLDSPVETSIISILVIWSHAIAILNERLAKSLYQENSLIDSEPWTCDHKIPISRSPYNQLFRLFEDHATLRNWRGLWHDDNQIV